MSIVGFRAQNHPQQTGRRGAKDAVDDRGTDPAFIGSLERRLGKFTLDVAASCTNTKAEDYYTIEQDGLLKPWHGQVWCNPPYSDCGAWVRKAWAEWNWEHHPSEPGPFDGGGAQSWFKETPRPPLELIAMLLPANRCEQKWWQELVEPYRDKPDSPLRVEFLPGRMRFDRPDAVIGPKGDRPPFGCCLLIWGGEA